MNNILKGIFFILLLTPVLALGSCQKGEDREKLVPALTRPGGEPTGTVVVTSTAVPTATTAPTATPAATVTPTAASYLEAGWQYMVNEEYELALNEFAIAVELDPTAADAHEARGAAYALLGEYEKAIADFDQAIELDPNFAMAYSDRGNAYNDLGLYEKAFPDLNRAIEFDNQLKNAFFNRGTVIRISILSSRIEWISHG